MRCSVVWQTIKTEHGNGSYAVLDGSATVRTANGTKSTQLGGSTPEALASILMWELSTEDDCPGCV